MNISKFVIKITFFIFLFSCRSSSELPQCSIIKFHGLFAYEFSDELWSSDDMIFRKQALFFLENDRIVMDKGIFIFEYQIINKEYCELFKLNSNTLYYNNGLTDSIHSALDTMTTQKMEKNKMTYKIFEINLEAIHLGLRPVYIKRGRTYSKEMMPAFLIVNFNEIKAV